MTLGKHKIVHAMPKSSPNTTPEPIEGNVKRIAQLNPPIPIKLITTNRVASFRAETAPRRLTITRANNSPEKYRFSEMPIRVPIYAP